MPEVERAGRTLKEKVREVWNSLTETMVIQLTYCACMTLNMFPKSNSIAGVSPREIFTGVIVDYKRHCKLSFGEYVQVYAENSITNTMESRTFGAISFGSAGNMQGTYLFLCLTSWKIIESWVEDPMPAEVIELINVQALKTTSITLQSEIKIGGILLDENDVDEYEPHVPVQRVVKRCNGLMTEIFVDDEPDQESKIIEDKKWSNKIVSYTSNIQEPDAANLSIPKAIRLYGVGDVASIMKETGKLQDKGVWTPIKYENIEDKSKIIRRLLFLKRK